MEFYPEVHQHTAGLVLYYDNLNYFYLRKYYSETLGQSALSVVLRRKRLRDRVSIELKDSDIGRSGPDANED